MNEQRVIGIIQRLTYQRTSSMIEIVKQRNRRENKGLPSPLFIFPCSNFRCHAHQSKGIDGGDLFKYVLTEYGIIRNASVTSTTNVKNCC